MILFASSTPVNIEKLYNEALIREYAEQYEVNADLAVAIAKSESDLLSKAKNSSSTASGIYQWLKGSWESICLPLGFVDVFNARENIECAIITIKNGGIGHWNASRHVWGNQPALTMDYLKTYVILE